MFSERELADLRHWQEAVAYHGPEFAEAFPHFHECRPLTRAEIDALCERLNFHNEKEKRVPDFVAISKSLERLL